MHKFSGTQNECILGQSGYPHCSAHIRIFRPGIYYSRTSLNPYPSVDGLGYGLSGGMGSRGVLKIDLKMGEFFLQTKHLRSLKIVCQKGFLHISGLVNTDLSIECAQ
jgi:hypothetical protein